MPEDGLVEMDIASAANPGFRPFAAWDCGQTAVRSSSHATTWCVRDCNGDTPGITGYGIQEVRAYTEHWLNRSGTA